MEKKSDRQDGKEISKTYTVYTLKNNGELKNYTQHRFRRNNRNNEH